MEIDSTVNINSLHPLCNINLNFKLRDEIIFFQKDLLCADKFILYCSEVIIYSIENYPESISEFFTFKIDYIKTPSDRPTSIIVQNADMLSAYKNSNVLDKQILTLDPLYGAEFSEQPLESKIIHISFPKLNSFSEKIIACVTNYGQCEIMTINSRNNTYNNTILQVNKLWLEIFPASLYYNKTLKEFQKIREYIEDYTITNCCWLDKIIQLNESILFCTTISGWIIGICIKKQQLWFMELQFKFKTDLYKINHIQSYTYIMKNGIHRTILICGDIKGTIKVFKFDENSKQLIEIYNLWNTKDHMSSRTYLINYCNKNDLLFLTTSKSSHLLLFILSANDDNKKIFSKTEFCDTQITGIDSINPYEYIICTANGSTKLLKIIKSQQNTNYITQLINIPNDFETENYISIGMLATPNKVGWMFLFYPHKMYIQMHNIKNFGFISVYTLNTINPLKILKNIPFEEYSELENYNDCNEIIRLKIQKKISNENYSNFCIEPIEISENFLHRLRIKLVIIQGIGSSNLRKIKNRGEDIDIAENNIILTIKTISAYRRLEYLKCIENLSNFQKQTIKCLRAILLNYLVANFNDNYSHVRNILKISIENILECTKNILVDFTENCSYCRQNVDLPSESCVHDFPRCCISFVQIPEIKALYCKRCKASALNDDRLLKEILFVNEKIKCTFCNIPLL